MLKLQGISKKTRDHYLFQDFDFEAQPGQITVITGKSGSGKTTLLNIIAGIKRVDAGQYYFENRAIDFQNDMTMSLFRNLNISYILQDFGLLADYTVRENCLLPFQIRKNPDLSLINLQLSKLSETLGLLNLLDEKPEQLSGGQKQRVSIMRSLLLNPMILLADEPTSNLDQDNFNLVMEMFLDFKKKNKILILATHDQRLLEMADRIYSLT